MESSFNEFNEHHKLKVVTWSAGSYAVFPSNFGMSDGNFVGTDGQFGSCPTGSFISFERFGRFKMAENGIRG